MISTSYNPGLQSTNPAGVSQLKLQVAQNTTQINYLLQQGQGTAPEVIAELADHEARISAVEAIDPNQNAKIAALEAKDIVHETRMTNIETVNTTQDGRLTTLESSSGTDYNLYKGPDFTIRTYTGTNRNINSQATWNSVLPNLQDGDICTLIASFNITSEMIISKAIKLTGAFTIQSSTLTGLVQINSPDVQIDSNVTLLNSKQDINGYCVKVNPTADRFVSYAKLSFYRWGYYCLGGSFLLQGQLTMLSGYAQAAMGVFIQDLTKNSTVNNMTFIRQLSANTPTYIAITHQNGGLFDARLTVSNCTIQNNVGSLQFFVYINLPQKTAGKLPSLAIFNNTYQVSSTADNNIVLRTGQSANFFENIIIKNNTSLSHLSLMHLLIQNQSSSQTWYPCSFYSDNNVMRNSTRSATHTYVTQNMDIAVLNSSYPNIATNYRYNKVPIDDLYNVNVNSLKSLDQLKPYDFTTFTTPTYSGIIRDVNSVATLSQAITDASHFDIIRFNASFTISALITVNKSLKFTNADKYIIYATDECFNLTAPFCWYDKTCRFSSNKTSGAFFMFQGSNGPFLRWESELSYKCSPFSLTGSFDITGSFINTQTNLQTDTFATINSMSQNSSLHDITLLLQGNSGTQVFCNFLAGVWQGNLSIIDVSIPALMLNTFFITSNFTNTSSRSCALEIIGCNWESNDSDIAIYQNDVVNYAKFKGMLFRDNVCRTTVFGTNYYGFVRLNNNGTQKTMNSCPFVFDNNTLSVTKDLVSNYVSIYGKLLTRNDVWIDTANAWRFQNNQMQDIMTLQAEMPKLQAQLDEHLDTIEMLQNDVKQSGLVESVWNENPEDRYYQNPVVKGIDNYYTNIQIQVNGQTITDLEADKYSIPNVTSTTIPTLTFTSIVPYMWIKYNRYVYPQPVNNAGNWVSAESGITMNSSYQFTSCNQSADVKLPFYIVQADALRRTVLVPITTVGAFNANNFIKYGRIQANVTATQIFLNCVNMIDWSMEPGFNIPTYAFSGCTGLTQWRGQSVGTIGTYAFYNCTKMRGDVDLKTCGNLGNNAFAGSGIDLVYLGEQTTLGTSAFNGCLNLKYAIFNESNGSILSINFSQSMFQNCPKLVDLAMINMSKLKTLGSNCFAASTSFNVSNYLMFTQVNSFGLNCFSGCTSLSGVEGILYLGYDSSINVSWNGNTFNNNTGMRQVYIKTSATDYPAWTGNTAIKNIVYSGASPISLAVGHFSTCTNLQSYDTTLSGMVSLINVVTIPTTAFYNCTSVKIFNFNYAVVITAGSMFGCKPNTINWFGGSPRTVSAADLTSWGISNYQSFSGSGTATLTFVW